MPGFPGMGSSRTPLGRHWLLDPDVAFLNHGGFGACPIPVLEAQTRWRERIEREPTQFFSVELEKHADQAREHVASFLDANADDLAFVPNATSGVNTVLRSLAFSPGDELLTTSQAYNACINALRYVAERSGAKVAVAHVPFPVASEDDVVAAVLAGVTPRTRLALLDHVSSPTGLVFPVARLVRELKARGVDALVDGAHAPGMLSLSLRELDAAYYTGNFHKWVCAPKGAAFLWVHPERQALIRPLSISHGANAPRTDRSRFRLEADWLGTHDPTPYLCVPDALRFMGSLLPGGWEAVRAHNHALALSGRAALCRVLDIASPCPDDMIGSLASVPLPPARPGATSPAFLVGDALQEVLFREHRIQLRIAPWPHPPHRLLRVSAQVYGTLAEVERLAEVLKTLLR